MSEWAQNNGEMKLHIILHVYKYIYIASTADELMITEQW